MMAEPTFMATPKPELTLETFRTSINGVLRRHTVEAHVSRERLFEEDIARVMPASTRLIDPQESAFLWRHSKEFRWDLAYYGGAWTNGTSFTGLQTKKISVNGEFSDVKDAEFYWQFLLKGEEKAFFLNPCNEGGRIIMFGALPGVSYLRLVDAYDKHERIEAGRINFIQIGKRHEAHRVAFVDDVSIRQ